MRLKQIFLIGGIVLIVMVAVYIATALGGQ